MKCGEEGGTDLEFPGHSIKYFNILPNTGVNSLLLNTILRHSIIKLNECCKEVGLIMIHWPYT